MISDRSAYLNASSKNLQVLGVHPLLHLPPAVAALPHLERLLYFTTVDVPEPLGLPLGPPGQPPYPMWASLRWLGLPWTVASRRWGARLRPFPLPCSPCQSEPAHAHQVRRTTNHMRRVHWLPSSPAPLPPRPCRRSVRALRAARRLEYFCCIDIPPAPAGEEEQQHWRAFWGWAAAHPPLKVLSFDASPNSQDELDLNMALWDATIALARRRPSLLIRRNVPADPGWRWDAGGDGPEGEAGSRIDWVKSSVDRSSDFFYFWEEMATLAEPPTS